MLPFSVVIANGSATYETAKRVAKSAGSAKHRNREWNRRNRCNHCEVYPSLGIQDFIRAEDWPKRVMKYMLSQVRIKPIIRAIQDTWCGSYPLHRQRPGKHSSANQDQEADNKNRHRNLFVSTDQVFVNYFMHLAYSEVVIDFFKFSCRLDFTALTACSTALSIAFESERPCPTKTKPSKPKSGAEPISFGSGILRTLPKAGLAKAAQFCAVG